MAKRKPTPRTGKPQDNQQQYSWEEIEGAVGASDGTSGGGAGSGTPDAELALRVGDRRLNRGDVSSDRRKLFPERENRKPGKSQSNTRKFSSNRRKDSGPTSKPLRKPASQKRGK
jgi:hypothetical protein